MDADVHRPSCNELSGFAVKMQPVWLTTRILWIAVRILLAFWLSSRGSLFYYQGF